MDFFEFILVISVAVVLPIAVLKLILDYRREQRELPSGRRGEEALTVSELKALIRQEVDDATAPLARQVERLEQEQRLLPPAAADANPGDAGVSEISLPPGPPPAR